MLASPLDIGVIDIVIVSLPALVVSNLLAASTVLEFTQ